MKTLKQWAQELPAAFREEVEQIIGPTKHTQPFQNMVEFLEYVIYHYENSAVGQLKTSAHWRRLLNQYAMGYATTFHVSYYTEPSVELPYVRSTGENVQAFDLFHAVDIVMALHGIKLNNISYVHSKEACCKV